LDTKNLSQVIAILKEHPETNVSYFNKLKAVKLAIAEDNLNAYKLLVVELKFVSSFAEEGAELLNFAISEEKPGFVKLILSNLEFQPNVFAVHEAVKTESFEIIDFIITDSRFAQFEFELLMALASCPNQMLIKHVLTIISPNVPPSKAMILLARSADHDLEDNVRMMAILLRGSGFLNAINSSMIDYCIANNAWKVLGTLMSIGFPQYYEGKKPGLFYGLELLLSKLRIAMDLQISLDGILALQAESKAVNDYLKAFKDSFIRFPPRLRAEDWFTSLLYEFGTEKFVKISNIQIMNIYIEISKAPARASDEEFRQMVLEVIVSPKN
jgi:hypothetical protein